MEGEKNVEAEQSCLSGDFEWLAGDQCGRQAARVRGVRIYPCMRKGRRTVRSRSLHHCCWMAALTMS